MKKRLVLAAAVVLAGWVGLAIGIPEAQVGEAAAAVQAPAVPLEFDFMVSASCTPTCGSLHGTSCPTPGAIKRCYHICGEPDICVCQNNNTWSCP